MSSSGAIGGFAVPGFQTIRETAERSILWGQTGNEHAPAIYFRGVVASGTVDSSSSPTSDLIPGLVLAQLSNGKFTNYDPDSATAEQRIAVAINGLSLRMVDLDNNGVDRFCPVLVGGAVRAGNLTGLDAQARAQLSKNFIFDDDLLGESLPYKGVKIVTGDTTLTSADSSYLIVTDGAGASDHTLPALATSEGVRIRFLNEADQNLTITSAEGNNIIAFNDAAASSVAFSTVGELIGAQIEVTAVRVNAGLVWVATPLSSNTVTVA